MGGVLSEAKTLGSVLTAAAEYLATRDVEHAGLVAKLLAARLLNCPHLQLPSRFHEALSEAQLAAMRRGLKRAAAHEPVQYITGQAGFMGHVFKSDSRALIPRPETEGLVERVLDCDALWALENPVIVDVGTGSGCIIVSLALARPDARCVGLDLSDEALALARENARELGAADRVGFAKGELCDHVEPESIDAIVANLPYIATDELEQLPRNVCDYEPRTALDGGEDGLVVLTPTIQDAAMALKPGGWIFLEIGETQGAVVSGLLAEAGFVEIVTTPDLAGRDRVVTGRLAS